MKKTRALFLDRASLYPQDVDFSSLEAVANWSWFENAKVSDIADQLETAEVIVTNKIRLDRAALERCEQLKLVCVAATGFNNVDVAAAEQLGIKVCNVRAYATASVVQHVFSLLLSLNRKLASYQASAVDGRWSHSDFFCYFGEPFGDLEGKTLGIIGFGELGKSVARVAECFGMKVLVARRHGSAYGDSCGGRVDLTALLSTADVVSLHCPLTESNRHMISENELSLMKTEAILINTARGGLIDERALLNALKNKQIAGAALDVLEEEPPAIGHELLSYCADNLIITPHIAWASRESRQRLVDEIAQNIRMFLQGEPRNIV